MKKCFKYTHIKIDFCEFDSSWKNQSSYTITIIHSFLKGVIDLVVYLLGYDHSNVFESIFCHNFSQMGTAILIYTTHTNTTTNKFKVDHYISPLTSNSQPSLSSRREQYKDIKYRSIVTSSNKMPWFLFTKDN